jgi:hypothetical protein
MSIVVYPPTFGLMTALVGLRLSIAWRCSSISAGSGGVVPIMVERTHTIRAFCEGSRGVVAFVLRYASMVPDVWCGRLLCV